MVEINWTKFALQDLNEIAEFISKDSVRYAQMTVKYLFESLSLLKSHPKAGRIVPEFNESNLRELIRGSYRIVHRIVAKDRVDILTVHHASRLFKNSLLLKK
jgi:plasmid stabilization system protein ParE